MKRNESSQIIALIPAHNEERTIAKVILSAQKYADEVIVCDDGSTDMTRMIAERLGAKVLRHSSREGKGEAFRMLFEKACELAPDVVVTLDGDGQHDPDQIPMLVDPILVGKGDVVVGSRYLEGSQSDVPFFRRVGLSAINFLCRRTMSVSTRDTQSGFRAYSLKALKVLSDCEEKGFGIESEQLSLAAKNGLSVVEVPVNVRYGGLENTSKKSSLSHGGELIASILGLVVEDRPLLYLGLPGTLLALMGLGLAAYLVWLFNITRYFSVPISIMALGASFLGLLLIIAAITLQGLKRLKEAVESKLRK
jgi:glycosyltransferase involved in cell wall biosynthesis